MHDKLELDVCNGHRNRAWQQSPLQALQEVLQA
jgi:hypothetical protein